MKAEPVRYDDENKCYSRTTSEDATHLRLNMHGSFPTRIIPIRGQVQGRPSWEWNGDVEKPTLAPSILTWCDLPNGKKVCHSFIRNGMVEYLSDSTHEFAGKTVELLDVD